VVVPDLRGLDEADAVSALVDAGLRAGDRILRSSAQVREGAVIRTSPSAGTLVARGTTVDYVISTGPAPTTAPVTPPPTVEPPRTPRPTRRPTPEPTRTPRPTPAPTRTPPPTASPTPSVSPAPDADRLARILESGVIRVNVSPDDAPWSSLNAQGAPGGFEVAIARQIARRLGIRAEFTTLSAAEVSGGSWEDRFDIALARFAETEGQAGLLDLTAPYAYDPGQLAATAESGLTSIEELAGQAICVAAGSLAEAWLNGTLALVAPPLEPAAPPEGATAFSVASDAECAALIAAGGAPFAGWLASGVTIDRAVADGTPIVPAGDPVFWAPIAIATDPVPGDSATLMTRLDEVLAELVADGTLTRQSQRFFDRDLTQVPGAAPPLEASPSPVP
jgi:polar amino acid transport system substrate-binding protein